ncbi:MAG: Glu-tRNA(Gln) amidotransferase subunit GatD [Candidatus Micrarchaeia archaeon]|jgi:glutamyl-tRNA(Gln) amidotransferase subunit D
MYSEEIESALKKGKIEIGDEIRLFSSKGRFEGTLMPRPDLGDNNILVIKLSNGYNIGIRFEKGDKIEKILSKKAPAIERSISTKHTKKPNLPNVSLIYTGGTIGSKIDYQSGGVFMLTKPEELLGEVPELEGIANIDVNPLMSVASEDMTYIEWQKIAKAVADSLKKNRGVVITHGTDTMHYTSAVLSFMLNNLNAPVVMTGSQRSSDRGSSDAFMNLVCSMHLAAKSDIAEVVVCMHETSSDNHCSVIRGTKARKMHTSRRDAFKPINNKPIARVSRDGEIEYLSTYKKKGEGELKLLSGYEPKVALVKAYPNSDPNIIDYYLSKGYKGLIIEGTGLGHTPVSTLHKEYSWLDNVKKAVDSGMIIGITSQCLYGRVNPNVYRNLRLLSNAGAIYCEDMLPEVAYVKLGFLLGNYKKEEAKKLLNVNLAGEITKRSEVDSFI